MKIPKKFLRDWDDGHKIEFHSGQRRGLTEPERAFALKLIGNNVKGKEFTDDEKRLYYRLILFFCGDSMNVVPKEATQECPVCEREIEHMFDRHVMICRAKQAMNKKNHAKIDPVVWEMLGGVQ